MSTDPHIYQRPVELLQSLIRFDTTNPPGNETECVQYVNELLTAAGYETTILAKAPQRPNLIARLPGRGQAPPLLLYGHVDVVTTVGQEWTHPPFEGVIADGFVWGRGTLDMKGGVAMMLSAFLRAKLEGLTPPGDVVLAVLSDEEAEGIHGAKFLVEQHPEQFEGIRYALGEFGGFSMQIAGRKFYPIQIAEKQICWMKATLRGPGGHGSLPLRGGAMSKLGAMLRRLEKHLLPIHVTPAARVMLGGIAKALPFPASLALRGLLNPVLAGPLLSLMGEQGEAFTALLRNTVNATIVRGGEKINVIPSQISVEMDGRLLPGYQPEDMLAELRPILGEAVEIEVLSHDPGPSEPDMGLFDTLAGVLRQADPEGIPVPFLLPAVTDGRFFSQLGIQTYGFTPMQLPAEIDCLRAAHNVDERIPVGAPAFGAEAVYQVLERFHE